MSRKQKRYGALAKAFYKLLRETAFKPRKWEHYYGPTSPTPGAGRKD